MGSSRRSASPGDGTGVRRPATRALGPLRSVGSAATPQCGFSRPAHCGRSPQRAATNRCPKAERWPYFVLAVTARWEMGHSEYMPSGTRSRLLLRSPCFKQTPSWDLPQKSHKNLAPSHSAPKSKWDYLGPVKLHSGCASKTEYLNDWLLPIPPHYSER